MINQRKYKCSVDGCNNFGHAKGFCNKHYERNRKYGTPTPTEADGFKEPPVIITSRRERREHKQKQRRLDMKLKAINYKGGACVICGYNRCPQALTFHHVNKTTKEFNLSIAFEKYKKSWEELKTELDKCILLCSNCHKELEAGFFEDEYVATVARPPKLIVSIRKCSIDGCNKEVFAKELCQKHYDRKIHGKTIECEYINSGKICSVDGCESPAYSKGMCMIHYRRMKEHGTT